MRVEDEPPDRHRRQAAIVHQFVEVRITVLHRVEPKGVEQVERVLRSDPLRAQGETQRLGLRIVGAAAQRVGQVVEQRELFVGRQPGVVRDVVGRADEAIEGEDDRPAPPVDQPGRHGKVLVARRLARQRLADRRHTRSAFGIGA